MVDIRVSALVETFQSHLDGGLGSWNISVAGNFTMESQTLWHGSRLLRNDWIRKQTEHEYLQTLLRSDAESGFSVFLDEHQDIFGLDEIYLELLG